MARRQIARASVYGALPGSAQRRFTMPSGPKVEEKRLARYHCGAVEQKTQCDSESPLSLCISPTPTMTPSARMSAALRPSCAWCSACRMNSAFTAFARAICKNEGVKAVSTLRTANRDCTGYLVCPVKAFKVVLRLDAALCRVVGRRIALQE